MNVISPQIIENLSGTLARASAENLRVSPRGGNATQEKFLPPFDVELNLDLTQLNHVVEYEPANLTISVEAGMTLAALQNVLRAHKQFLPIDPPLAERATIGGIIAANAYGPLRLRYGAIRDWLIGVRAVLADGTLIRGGGKVVKNVAGYDLPKLFVGSFGTLGVIVEATFKLAPLPPFGRTLVASFDELSGAINVLMPILHMPVLPNALELLDPPTAYVARLGNANRFVLVAQFAGAVAAVDRQTRDTEALCRQHNAAEIRALENMEEQALWARLRDLTATLSGADATLIEMRLLPSQLELAINKIQALASERESTVALFARAAQTLWVALRGDDDAVRELVLAMREWLTQRKGYLVVQHLPATLKGQLDVWGPLRSDYVIMQRLKAQFDPQNILNPGVFVGGL